FMERLALGVLAIGWILLGPIPACEDGFAKGAASADINYVYDRIGRLIGVVDPAGTPRCTTTTRSAISPASLDRARRSSLSSTSTPRPARRAQSSRFSARDSTRRRARTP